MTGSLNSASDAETLAVLKNTVDIIPGFIYEYVRLPDGTNHLPYVSRGVEKLMGISLDDLKDDASIIWSLVIDEDRELFENSVEMAICQQTVWRLTWRIRTPQGELKWLRGESTKIEAKEDGSFTNNGVVVDVSNEMELAHEVKAARRRSELAVQTLKEITDLVPGFVYKYRHYPETDHCFFSYISEGSDDLLGIPAEELRRDADCMWRLFHPDDQDRVLNELKKNMKNKAPWCMSWRLTTTTGVKKWVRDESTPAKPLNDGGFEWVGILQDITREKNAELAAARARHMLAEVNNLIPGCVYIYRHYTNGRCYFPYVSKGVEELMGVKAELLKEDASHMWNLYPKEDQELVLAAMHTNIKSGKPWRLHWRIITPQGQLKWVRCEATPPQPKPDGSFEWIGVIQDVTSEKKAEESAAHAQRMLDEVNNVIPGCVYLLKQPVEGERTFVYLSHGAVEMFGLPMEVMRKDVGFLYDLTVPEDLARLKEGRMKSLENKSSWHIVWRIKRPTGEVRWIRCDTKPYRKDDDGSTLWAGVLIDITDERRLQEEAAQAKKMLAEVNNVIPGCVYLVKQPKEGERFLLYLSKGAAEMFGLPMEAMQSDLNFLYDVTYPEDLPRMRTTRHEALQKNLAWHHVWRIQRPSGEVRWIRCDTKPYRTEDDGGMLWAGVFVDVTEERSQQEAAAHAKRMLSEVNNVIPGCVYLVRQIKDGDRVCIYLSQGAEDMFGLPLEKMQQDMNFLFDVSHPDDLDRMKTTRLDALARSVPWHHVWRVKHPSGDIRWIRCDTKPYRKEDDGNELWAGVFIDVTEERKLQEELTLARIQAEESSHAKSDFLSNVSHEMRTPLNGILGYTQLLLHELQLEGQAANNLESIQKCGDHLLSVINKVLDMAKIESGRLQLDLQSTALFRTLDEVITIISPLAESKGLVFNVDIDEELPAYILTDGSRLRQILINILNNSVKFTDRGSVSLKVHTEGDNLILNVSDTGPGMSQEDLERIFEPFTRLNQSRHKEGTGLGLTITQRLTRALGGKLSADSKLGKGSVFTVNLPFEETAAVEENEDNSGFELHPLPPDVHAHILIVDDKAYNRDVVKQWLIKAHFEISEAENGQEALDVLRQTDVSLVLMDLRMPVMSGYQCAQQIREDPKLQHLPLVALSASVFPGDVKKVLMSGFDAYLAKPCNLNQLFNKIYELLGLQSDHYVTNKRAPSSTSQSTSSHSSHNRVQQKSLPQSDIEHMEELSALGDIEGLNNLLNKLSIRPEYSHQVTQLQHCLQQLDMDAFLKSLH
ncbi:PAS domain-containing protein [Spongorhabdus nitratireducens]